MNSSMLKKKEELASVSCLLSGMEMDTARTMGLRLTKDASMTPYLIEILRY